MKVIQIRFPVILLAISLTVIGLTNCGQENSKSANIAVDTLNANVEIAPDTVESASTVLIVHDNIITTDTKKQEVKANQKKVTEPLIKSPAKQNVVIKKPASNTPETTPAAKPVAQPVAKVPVVKVPEVVKPTPVPQTKPVETPVPAPIVISKPAQNSWIVPAKYQSMKSPYPNNQESITLGKSLYTTHCKSCHGSKGDGKGTKAASLDTEMRSFLGSGFKAQNQGEVFYKSIIGRKDMPKFDKKLPDDEEQWAVVNYIMSL